MAVALASCQFLTRKRAVSVKPYNLSLLNFLDEIVMKNTLKWLLSFPGVPTLHSHLIKLIADLPIPYLKNSVYPKPFFTDALIRRPNILFLFGLFFSLNVSAQNIYYVKPVSSGTGDGSSWSNASGDLQAMINAVSVGDNIFVARGTYKPTRKANALTVITPKNRDNAFVLKTGVKLYGGFFGTESSLSQRILTTADYTTLSGDFNDDDGISLTDQGVITYTRNGENAYHVVIAAGVENVILDGFKITGGRANSDGEITVNALVIHRDIGAGIEIESSSFTLQNCSVENSHASNLGGGLYSYKSNLKIENSTIRQNKADDGGGVTLREGITVVSQSSIQKNQAVESGGGIWVSGDDMAITNTHIESNLARNGGALYNRNQGNVTINSSFISGNTATANGGGFLNANDSDIQVVNSLISGNKAGNGGGGLYNANVATLYNCTISGNNANTGGGIYRSGGVQTVLNCIIWANSQGMAGEGTTSYSIVQGGGSGVNTVDEDPRFVNSPVFSTAPFTTGDYRTQSCWVENSGDTTGISQILPLTDLVNNPRYLDGVDIGAYERTSRSVSSRIYVKVGGTGNGTRWNDAFGDLQEAINAACTNDTLFVAHGTYLPTRKATSLYVITPNQRDNSFVLKSGIKIYGGFIGTENFISERKASNEIETYLSGDFSNNDQLIGEGKTLSIIDNNENAFHVAIAAGVENTLLDDIAITQGNANGSGTISINGVAVYRDNAGGLYVQNSKSVTLNNCRVAGNQADNRGGGISGYASLVTIARSTISRNRAGDGGGIGLRDGAKGVISHSQISGNRALADAGGLYISTPSTQLNLNTCEVTSNYARSDGGGMRVSESAVTVNGGRIDENESYGAGGGIFNVNDAHLYFNDASLSKNKAGGNGGGVWNGRNSGQDVNTAQVYFTRALISENDGGDRGGGIYNFNAQGDETCIIRWSRITKNTARNGAGIANVRIFSNSRKTSAYIWNSLIDQNAARNDGGGIYNDEEARVYMYNTTVAYNTAPNGGGIYNDNYSCPTGESDFCFNDRATAFLYNSIVWGNIANNGAGIYEAEYTYAAKKYHSLVQGSGAGGDGNLDGKVLDPLFTDPANSDFTLLPWSPCVDAGFNNYSSQDKDLAGNARIRSSLVDIGAYESAGSFGGTLYVKEGSTGNGTSWNTPLGQLSGALAVAHYSTKIKEIYVAKGSYSPQFTPAGAPTPEQDRTFLLPSNVKIYGGFDPDKGITNLSHERLSAVTYLDGKLSDNLGVYHVVVAAGELGTAVLDGFVIQNGMAKTAEDPVDATINGETVSRKYGAGIYLANASPKLSKLIIRNNEAVRGAGIYVVRSESEISQTIISGNTSDSGGGGVATGTSGNAHFINVLITANIAGQSGGGMNNSANPSLTNVTISGNNAISGAEWYNGTGIAVIRNSIIWGNGIQGILYNYQYSLIQGQTATANKNISGDTNPMFVGNGDFRLQLGSPVVNKGNNASFTGLTATTKDLAGNSRVYDFANAGLIDMGAYELQDLMTPLRYVRSTEAGNGSGNSWANASADLQAMVNTSGVEQVWVAAGTYKPTSIAGNGSGDRDKAFLLKTNVRIYGGFAGNETTLEARRLDLTNNQSTLSGDLGNANESSDNAYHVVIAAGELGSAEINGFTIKGGKANGSGNISVNGYNIARNFGGGIFIHTSRPLLSNITISDNAASSGAGIYHNSAAPELLNVTISNNTASSNGGGMYNNNSNPKLSMTSLMGNQAGSNGGGMYNTASDPIMTGVSFRGNLADDNGGGINNASGSKPVISNALFSGNKAGNGGGMYSNNASMPVVSNATFAGNNASNGGAIYNIVSGTQLKLYNSIIYGNSSGVIDASQAEASVIHYCNVQGYTGGTGNVQSDPFFTTSKSHTNAPFIDGNYLLQTSSPAINRGDPKTNETNYALQSGSKDLTGNNRIINNRVDLGAYEYSCDVSLASHASSVSHWISSAKNYLYAACDLFAVVEPAGIAPVQGSLTVQSWTEQNIVQHKAARFVRRHYDLTPTENNENATANVTLFFTKDDFEHYNSNYGAQSGFELPVNPGDDKSKLFVVQYHNGNGQTDLSDTERKLVSPTSVIWNNDLRFWEVKFTVNGFSAFFVTGQSAVALPVTLVSFQAQRKESKVHVSWQTSSEVNASHFEIERSGNGKTWQTMGNVQTNGDGKGIYEHIDASPLSNINYYRLKMVDRDGSYSYSRIVSASMMNIIQVLKVSVYPNPVTSGTLTVTTSGIGKPDITVYDLLGRKVNAIMQKETKGEIALDVSRLPVGVYMIAIRRGQEYTHQRFVVN